MAAVVIAWPWPAPEVDWRMPLAEALANKDCARAATIVNGAASAGALEAYDMLAKRESLSPCADDPRLTAPAPNYIALLREERAAETTTQAQLLSDRTQALPLWRRNYVRGVDYFCREPYDVERHADQAAVAAALPDKGGWSLAPYRWRRAICIGVVENLAAALAVQSEAPAKDLAFQIASHPPVADASAAKVVRAELVLQHGYIPIAAAHEGSALLNLARSIEWTSLHSAAEDGDPQAIALMIALLHDRRFLLDARTITGTHKEPYYWILRGRRLNLPASSLDGEIEPALTTAERAKIAADEEYDWRRRQAPDRDD